MIQIPNITFLSLVGKYWHFILLLKEVPTFIKSATFVHFGVHFVLELEHTFHLTFNNHNFT